MQGLRLYKSEKLCSRTAVKLLFDTGENLVAYPLRVVYKLHEADTAQARFLITIPKKRIHHAVDRVLLRRRIRESYRLHRRSLLHPALQRSGVAADLAFIYISNEKIDFHLIEEKMKVLLTRLADAATQTGGGEFPTSPKP